MQAELLHSTAESLQNQFLSGGLVLMLVGALMALLRRTPEEVWAWLKRQCTVSLDVMNSDPAFDWLSVWLNEIPYSKRARRLSLQTTRTGEEGERKTVFTPAPGHHFFLYRRRLVWLNRTREEGGGKGEEQMAGLVRRETYSVRCFGRSQQLIRELIEEARQMARRVARAETRIYVSTYGFWSEVGTLPHRPLASVILPAGVGEGIVSDVREFLAARAFYRALGIPYRRGYLLYGVPGTGKSSIIGALAHAENLNLYMLNIGSPGMNDEALAYLMATVRENSIILFEDIDVAQRGRELTTPDGQQVSPKGITFSGLLNALDGLAAREDCIVFMTTNHIEKLDAALIRPGRVDVKVHFDYADREQVYGLFRRFFPEAPHEAAAEFVQEVDRIPAVSMAELQQHLLKYKTDPRRAIERAGEIMAAPAAPEELSADGNNA